MFMRAIFFNGDLSKWDVLKVTSMNVMFFEATSFNHELCRPAWVFLKARKADLCTASAGTMCMAVFFSTPHLKRAVFACLKLSPKGDCPNGPHGPMEEWDVSSVTDMDKMFDDTSSFNGYISQ